MLRVIIGAVLSAIVLFVWGMAAWEYLGIHDGTVLKLPQADAVTKIFKEQNLRTGVYSVPALPDGTGTAEENKQEKEAWTAAHKEGPIYSIYYTAQGSEPMGPKMFAGGWAINLICTTIAACLLRLIAVSGIGYLRRVGCVTMMGVFAAVIGHGALWNWMYFPTSWVLAMIIDMVIGWTLVGIVLAAIIQAPASEAASTQA